MSIIGGVAAFSILGHMCFRTGKNMTDVISSGPSLAFVAYPEAVTTLPYSGLWAFLFFLMLFLLGFSSQIGEFAMKRWVTVLSITFAAYVDMVIAFCYDLFPKLKKATWAVAIAFCILIAACSSFMANHVGLLLIQNLTAFSFRPNGTGSTSCPSSVPPSPRVWLLESKSPCWSTSTNGRTSSMIWRRCTVRHLVSG